MMEWLNRVHFGDCLETLRKMPDGIVNTCVTSPPYFGLRDYGHAGQIGLEETPEQFIAKLVEVFREVRRVLRDDGTAWVNMGDSYCNTDKWGGGKNGNTGKQTVAEDGTVPSWQRQRRAVIEGVKPKDLIGVPWMLAFALRADGWYLRQDIIWAKPNPMPESITDRCTKSHEYIFLLSKSPRYYCDMAAIKEQGQTWTGRAGSFDRSGNPVADHVLPGQSAAQHRPRAAGVQRKAIAMGQEQGGYLGSNDEYSDRNKRSVWTVSTKPYSGAHFATFPTDLIEPCILAGAPAGGVVLDPFFGSGTTGEVAQNLGRNWIGCELNPAYKPLQDQRLSQPGLELA